MTIQPKYHWQFNERKGRVAHDAIAGVEARFHESVVWQAHGRIGPAVRSTSRKSRLVFAPEIGQFGTRDFTVAFGIKIIDTQDLDDMNIIGTRDVSGHGNWFSLRLQDNGRRLHFEVDENSKGKHYATAKTPRLSNLYDKKWHHIALVREGRTVQIYLDGTRVAGGASKTGIANINRAVDVKLGHYTRDTPIARYEDLRIYHAALTTEQIQALIPPANRSLNAGEIELVATDEATVVLKQDVVDLAPFSGHFKQLRLGPDTGATLYKDTDFKDVAQKLYADIPDIRFTKLGEFPRSVRIWSTVGEPFTGKWIIKAPNGQFLHRGKTHLQTAPKQWSNALFTFHYDLQQGRLQLLPGTDKDNARFTLSAVETPASLFVDDSDRLPGEFSLINQGADAWLELVAGNTFRWTRQKDQRAVFVRAVKFAENEGQVGELAQGEVALYEHRAYHGKTWILSDSAKDVAGEHKRFGDFGGLNDRTSSIRLGPDTGVTLFKHFNYRVADDNREEEIEDIVKNVPDLKESQIGDDALSSVKIFRTIAAEDVFASYTTKLSQDYRMVNDKLEEFSAYRTTLRFEPGAGAIEVSATDFTTIEVDGTTYEIHEEQSATLTPNELNFIMITSEADGLNTPGLKIQTSEMADNEQVVIFPNQEAHQQIAELEDGALWNAKDAQGNLIVDRAAHSQAEVASVQNTIKRVTATVAYQDAAPAANQSGSRVLSTERVVSGAAIAQPWELKFKPEPDAGERRQIQAQSAILKSRGLVAASVAANRPENGGIEEATVSEDDFTRLLSQATSSEAAPISEPAGKDTQLPGGTGFGSARLVGGIKRLNIRRRIRDAVKKATSVVVGAAKGVVHFVVTTATEVIDFVVDTVEKVAEFVEAVVEKVVKGIKQFIEFLQFLFDWGDILDTQRYLKQAINTSLDSAKQLAVDAKPHVTALVNDLQDGVEDGMNQLVKTLGGKPSEVEESGFEIPEALEWFLDKLIGGSKSSDSEATSGSGGENSPLASFVRQMLEAFEDAVGAGLRLSEGVFDSIQALIANPREPEVALIIIIEALRDAIIQSLDAVENVALSLLDVVSLAIDLFQGFLNAEIRIPFISDLLDFIGIGKLTVLNLATIILAIPVTVTAKLVTGEHLFADSVPMPLDLSNQTETPLAFASVTANLSAISDSTDSSSDSGSTAATDEPDSLRDLRKDLAFTTIATVADTTNHLIAGILDLFDVPGFEVTGGGDVDLSRLDESLGLIGSGFVRPLQALEITSIVLSLMSWSFSYPAQFEEFGDTNKEDRREIILWSYRGGTLAIDTLLMMTQDFQRMRRVEKTANVTWALLNAIDMILFSLYQAAVEEENDRIKRANISNEVFSALPNVISFVRSIDADPLIKAGLHLGHVATDVTAAVVTATTGGILIAEANKALKDAKAAP
jgi:hypothetical protein